MNRRDDPWAGIDDNAPEGQLYARRADASHPHDFFWAIDSQGHRLLVYRSTELANDSSLPRLRGISVELNADSLVLRLQQHNDLEIFTTLCLSLVERTRNTRPGTDTLDCILGHLERWHRFLGQVPAGLLTDEEVRGLYCELKFLEVELVSRLGPKAVDCWHGPAGHPQDFAVGTTLFEIKSHQAGAGSVISISSAEQLWHAGGDLFLVVYTIGASPQQAAGSMSILDLVNSVRGLLQTQNELDTFDNRLAGMGYFDHPDYGRTFFSVARPEFFRVEAGFPRIDRNSIPPAVCRLRYGIELPACLPFRSDPEWQSLGVANGN